MVALVFHLLVALGSTHGPTMASQPPEPQVPPALKGVRRIVCLGDSITQGGENPGGYVWLFRHYLSAIYPSAKIEIINAGISGHRSVEMVDRFDRDVIAKKPDLVTISCGVNDVWHGFYDHHDLGDGPGGIPLDEYRRNIEFMVDRAKHAGAKVYLLASTVIHEDLNGLENRKLQGYNAVLAEVAKKQGCGWVDMQAPFRKLITTFRDATGSSDNILTSDGVHMNDAGNQVMAQTLLTAFGVPDTERARMHWKISEDLVAARADKSKLKAVSQHGVSH